MSNVAEQIIREVSDKNIGFVVKRAADAKPLIQLGNMLIRRNHPVTMFVLEDSLTPEIPMFAVEQMNHLWGFSGHVFVFDLDLAAFACKCPLRKKIYFLDNLHWTKLGLCLYSSVAEVYLHDRLTILTTSDNHAKVEKVWKPPQQFKLSVENIECLVKKS